MTDTLNFRSISTVLDSWEQGRQNFSNEEELGKKILLNLFQADPTIKPVFGFTLHQNVEANPVLLMGVMVHGARMIQMLDGVLSLLGPDTDMLDEVLSGLGDRHEKFGVRKEHFALMGDAVREAISDLYGDDLFSKEQDLAWKEVFAVLSEKIVSSM